MKKIISFLLNKYVLIIISFIFGYGVCNLIFYANHQPNATDSVVKNLLMLSNKKFSNIYQQQVVNYNNSELVNEIEKNVNQAVNKTGDTLVYTKDQLKKITTTQDSKIDQSLPKNSTQKENDSTQKEQVIKSSNVNFYQDHQAFYYQLILKNYRFEDVIISINSETLKFSNYIGNSASAVINGKEILKEIDNKSNDKFSYSFNLPKYNNQKEPEINYLDNVITVKFYK
jgi:hypothetical protein